MAPCKYAIIVAGFVLFLNGQPALWAEGKSFTGVSRVENHTTTGSTHEIRMDSRFSDLNTLLERTSKQSGPLAMMMVRDDKIIYRNAFRGADTNYMRFAITSCSKWLIASTLMTLVDDGWLGIDDPVGRYLPSFMGRKGDMTIRHLLSHTSGLPRRLKPSDRKAIPNLTRFVNRLGRRISLDAKPGERFCYGNLSYQVATRLAEVVTAKPWNTLFQERIARPAGMVNTRFPLSGLGRGVNSAHATIQDYVRFLQMFKNNGLSPITGAQVLSAESVQEMVKSQTAGAEFRCVNQAAHKRAGRLEYGLGLWRERVDPITKAPSAVSHFGTAGFRGVISYAHNYIMVLGIEGDTFAQKAFLTGRFQKTLALIDQIVRGQMPAPL